MRIGIVVWMVIASSAAFAAPGKVDLPAVPSFELPPEEAGFVDPKRLRVDGKKLLDTDVKVKGYIIWIYDCITDIRKPKETKAQTQRRIDADPPLCERPKLYLGATRDTPPERGLWVVDVPRPPNKLEKQRLPKEDLAAWPKVPKYKLGDYVVISGKFALVSPHNERNSDGLLVYSAIEPAKPPASVPTATAPVTASPPVTKPPAKPRAPAQKKVDPKVENISNVSLATANKHAANKHWADAEEYYKRAIRSWDGNHFAWYGLGGVYAQQGDWKRAHEQFQRAVKLRPDQAMYQLWVGVASYEVAVKTAREALAAKQGVKPEDVRPDLSTINFDAARASLELAVVIEPSTWRAHYYLGRISRERDQARDAALAFTQALQAESTHQAPYVALGELYRKWDYPDEAIKVTTQGTQHVTDGNQVSDIWYVLGMAYDDKLNHAKAIEAFDKALEHKPDNVKAKFQRGQAYFKLGKYKQAKPDLEATVASDAPIVEFAKQQAQKMLMDIEAKKQ